MGGTITGRKIAKNVSLSILAQIISLAVAFVLNIIVPKFISEYEYAYWQTFSLYANYTGILHFGILDGIVLRYSQYDYEQLDKKAFRSQFAVLLVLDSICTAAILFFSACLFTDQYFYVGVFVAASVLTRNIIKYAVYSLQLTNRIRKYVTASIIQKVFYGIFVVLALLLGFRSFHWICLGELLGEVIAFVWTFTCNREIYIGKLDSLPATLRETKENLSAGIFLLISNWSAMVTIGAAKMIIQWRWDELVFGKVAFAFSVTSLFLTFVSAISVVLFPALKRMPENQLPEIYEKIRCVLSPILVCVLIFYYPGAFLIGIWLPKYAVSITYLGLLLPIIIYRTRVSLLTNNYLKAYRKERMLLAINLVTVILALGGGLAIASLLNNIDLMLVYTVLTFMGMSLMTERAVCKLIHKSFFKENLVEIAMTVAFIFSARYCTRVTGFFLYLAFLAAYLFLNRKTLAVNLRKLLKRA